MAKLFISYAREEVPFVSQLLRRLKLAGHEIWIDYQSLVPGQPWHEQLQRGIAEADLGLLVISTAAMASPYVQEEVERLQAQGTRILFLIFEAVQLPENLQGFEWVDFRSRYADATSKLLSLIEAPAPPLAPPPQKGFHMPILAWLLFLFSLPIPLISLFASWTLFLPFILVPLPYRILKRTYSYYQIRSALIFLPFSISLSLVYFQVPEGGALYTLISLAFLGSVVLGILLLLLMHAPPVQGWGQPITNRPKRQFNKETLARTEKKRSFAIEAAPEDIKISQALRHALEQSGHVYEEDQAMSEIDFVLISHYKNDTVLDPESNIVFPILVQSTASIASKLSRIQWIDFRLGVRHLNKIGDLLGEPEKLLRGLGIKPFNDQVVHPPIIEYLNSVYALVVFSQISSWGYIAVTHWQAIWQAEIQYSGAFFFLLIGQTLVSYLAWRHLKLRKGFLSNLPGQIIALLLPAITGVMLVSISGEFIFPDFFTDEQFFIALFPLFLYLILLAGFIFYLLRYAKDLWRWLPQTEKMPRKKPAED